MKLLIVESPNKIKKLRTFLDNSWTLGASVGHICDLPQKDIGIDLEEGTFAQKYQVYPDKSKVVDSLKNMAAKADEVYLASDPDREGEAIAWHVARLLKLDIKKIPRVCFFSITKEEVARALAAPRTIDLNLVDAYKTRRAVDRIFGYQLSPAIQRFGLKSAGRCQTPCLNIVVQRELEIRNFNTRKYYALKAFYKDGFFSEYAREDDKGNFKVTKVQSDEELQALMAQLHASEEHTVVNINAYEEEKRPKPPYITSSIITEAAAKLHFKPARTTQVLQSLFHKGHITYIRTDSTEISDEGLALARSVLEKEYPGLVMEKPVRYTAKKSAQGAHECIRPTHADDSSELAGDRDELALYTLIRTRFLASQCKPQIFKREDILFVTGAGINFLTRNRVETYKGFTAVYSEVESEEKEEEESNNASLDLQTDSVCVVEKYETPQLETKPPTRFKLSTLTKEIEKQGIGRPSTFSTIVQTPLDRGYYEEGKKGFLFPTQKGFDCIKLLSATMPSVIVSDYTRALEDDLDNISEAKDNYRNFIGKWYKDWTSLLEASKKSFDSLAKEMPPPAARPFSMEGAVVSKNKCPDCDVFMVSLKGKFGKYYKCPKCSKNVSEKMLKAKKSMEVSKKSGILCPLCRSPMVERGYKDKKSGKQMKFWGCSTYPVCKGARNAEPATAPQTKTEPVAQKTAAPQVEKPSPIKPAVQSQSAKDFSDDAWMIGA